MMSSDTANRKIIAEELAKDAPDWKRIEDASRRVVDSDPSSVRFSLDAAHIQRLGEHLVGKQETALSELIKNGFDADASTVSLSFEGEKVRGGTLVIEDDGLGMTEEVIRSAWMRISTNSKSEEPVSARYGRTRAGKKGIGRFAVQRLGRRLVLTTRPAGRTLGYPHRDRIGPTLRCGRVRYLTAHRLLSFARFAGRRNKAPHEIRPEQFQLGQTLVR